MNVLVEILHPAHVHVFRHAIRTWLDRGDKVLIISRDKDCANALLDSYGLPYISISRLGRGKLMLFSEMLLRDGRMWWLARRFKPDVLVGVMGVTIVQIAKLLRRPALVFYDTETGSLTRRFVYPLAHRVFTPDCYRGRVNGRHVTYPSYHELAYLHPAHFTPDAARVRSLGLDPDAPYFILRFVSWQASHDLGEVGLDSAFKENLVQRLLPHGQVLVSSEGPLPARLEEYRFRFPPDTMHHVMAFASLLVGESATMASESAVLGVPALYISNTGRGYTDELEARYQLVTRFRTSQSAQVFAFLDQLLAQGGLRGSGQQKREKLLADKVEAVSWMLDAVDKAVAEWG